MGMIVLKLNIYVNIDPELFVALKFYKNILKDTRISLVATLRIPQG